MILTSWPPDGDPDALHRSLRSALSPISPCSACWEVGCYLFDLHRADRSQRVENLENVLLGAKELEDVWARWVSCEPAFRGVTLKETATLWRSPFRRWHRLTMSMRLKCR